MTLRLDICLNARIYDEFVPERLSLLSNVVWLWRERFKIAVQAESVWLELLVSLLGIQMRRILVELRL